MEFKGTKGKWGFKLDEVRKSEQYNSFELDFDFSESDQNNLTLWCQSKELTEEELANAKLITCAHELLEMANNLHQLLEEHQPNWYLRSHHENIVDLIKRATE